MKLLSTPTKRQIDLGLAALRAAVATIFIAHGAQKLFVFGFDGVTAGFGQMGIPLAGLVGPAVALLEFFGGLALLAGLLTRLVAAGLAVNMLGAMLLVHLGAGFFLPNGYEFVLMLFGAAVALTITGAGALSLDARIAARATPASAPAPAIRRAA
jgi:putative oxidoreductase